MTSNRKANKIVTDIERRMDEFEYNDLTLSEVAYVFDVSYTTAWTWHINGRFPHEYQKPGGPKSPYLIPKQDILASIKKTAR